MTNMPPHAPIVEPPTPETFQATDGAAITSWRWPAAPHRPLFHWCHATGFHARTYTPLLNKLSAYANVVAWDMRGHGSSRDAGLRQQFRGWETYYDDLTAWLERQSQPVILGGHSVGATASLIAACRAPERVIGVVLCDPVLIGGSEAALLGMVKLLGMSHRFKLAAGALSRRPVFDSRQVAYEIYRRKPGFRSWPDDWLHAYVDNGFVSLPHSSNQQPIQENNGTDRPVQLACPPAWEALTFATTEHRVWRKLRRIPTRIEVLAAEKGSTFPSGQRPRLQRILPGVHIQQLAGSSHFLPMEEPERVIHTALDVISRARCQLGVTPPVR